MMFAMGNWCKNKTDGFYGNDMKNENENKENKINNIKSNWKWGEKKT